MNRPSELFLKERETTLSRNSPMESLQDNPLPMVGKKNLFRLLGYKSALKIFLNNLAKISHYYVLHRKLASFDTKNLPRAIIPLQLKIINNSDLEAITKMIPMLDFSSRKELVVRLLFYKAGFRNCYVSKTPEGKIACIQWLIYPSENEVINRHFRNRFYPLKKNQVMIENIFTFPKFRGMGVMSKATAEVMAIAREAGYENAITYVKKESLGALNLFMGLGFKINKLIIEYKVLNITKRIL